MIAGVALTTVYRGVTERALDERLGVYLKAIVSDVASPGDDAKLAPGQLGEPQFELTRSGWYWQVTRLDVEPSDLRASRSLFAARLPRLPDAERGATERRGYVLGPDDRRLRLLERDIDIGDEGRYLVQVAADAAEIDNQVRRFEWALGLTFAALALALVGTAALQVSYGLEPLRKLREGVGAIRRGEIDKIRGAFPADIAPLAAELNLLVDANREVVERARTQVGNLAHALKTPISVVLNEARASDAPFADKVREQVETMTRQVTYHLDRARAAARAGAVGVATDVEPVTAALARTFEKIHRDDPRDFQFVVSEGLRFRGEKQDLEEMLGNLVDNAGKWSRRCVLIEAAPATLASDERRYLQITVDDDGPGLTPEQRLEATKRGRRLDESKPGSGLGLSIVTDLAALYGGALALEDSPLGGLRARLTLPAT
ncbi:MAG: sensor histidine kinase [Methylobacteriaceae bacterium]|nr:sensor histidine kinase [Methylobacteriaceae bacterium]